MLRMIKITKRAGELGIGPKILDLYVCYRNWEHQLVMSMEPSMSADDLGRSGLPLQQEQQRNRLLPF